MKDNSRQQIKLGAIISYAGIAIKILAGLIYTPWLVAQIGKSNYGLFSLSLSIISMFAVDLGMGVAVARFLSKYKAENNREKEEQFLSMAFKLYFIMSFVLFIILAGMYFFIAGIYVELTALEIEKLKVIYIITGIFTAISFLFKPFEGILIANERFAFMKSIELVNKLLTIVLMVFALLLGYGLYSLVLINAFVGMLVIFFQYIYIAKKTDTKMHFLHWNKSILIELFYFSSWTTIAIVARRFIINIAPSILAATTGTVQVSIFAIAAVIEGYTITIGLAIGGLFLPKVTKLLVLQNHKEKINELNIQVGRIQLLVVGTIVIVFLTMGKEFIRLWMGTDFNDSYYVTCLLIAPFIITLTNQIGNTTLMAVNKVKYIAISTIITSVCCIVFSLLLSRQYGAIGAGIGIFIGNILGQIIYANIIYIRILKLDMMSFYINCHIKLALPLIFLGVSAFCIQMYFPVDSLILYIIKAFIVISAYFIVAWLISLNQSEKNLLLGLLKPLRKLIRK
jgi:O-antigen/teichoic acid export membrane protein